MIERRALCRCRQLATVRFAHVVIATGEPVTTGPMFYGCDNRRCLENIEALKRAKSCALNAGHWGACRVVVLDRYGGEVKPTVLRAPGAHYGAPRAPRRYSEVRP